MGLDVSRRNQAFKNGLLHLRPQTKVADFGLNGKQNKHNGGNQARHHFFSLFNLDGLVKSLKILYT